ncbi:uncharacterized protein LOC141591549 [Silene latifolia]|uniref:uncharacterized protein LOC141591549 n=1 Tax=Silene latifolia TaxID=37657 RepID=UPI003D7870F5
MELQTTTQPQTVYTEKPFIGSEDDEKFDPLYEQFYGQPFLHYLRSRYIPYSIPAYFKRDHPCDHLLMDILGNLHLPPPLEDEAEYVEEQLIKSLTKEVVTELIWKDTRSMTYTWNRKDLKHLYTAMIESAAHLVYFLHPRDELYRMGRCPDLQYELDQLWAKLREEAALLMQWALVVELTSTNNYHLVTEEFIADMLFDYPFSTRSRQKSLFLPIFPVVAEKDKDKLYKDIAEVVKDLEQPPLKPDEYTHWMMTFLRGNAFDVELNILSKIMDDRNKLPICFHEPLYSLLHQLLNTAKIRLKQKLLNVVQPLLDICQPVHHETSCVIIEIVEVAELRRIAAGNRFIGRSHLIWAFYKLGYALPLQIRRSVQLDTPDESHPPYHIYMAAAKLAVMSGDKCAKLLHFIFAVIHSKDIGFDGQGITNLYLDFELFEKACEEMENEIEPKHTVTVRPCRVVDAIIQDTRERYNI